MPYFHSVDLVDWRAICAKLGFHYISPLSENGVDITLKEIASSKYIITEAMHGAILADALRVPWHRFILSTPYTEGIRISEFKWADWMLSVQVNTPKTTLIQLYQKQKQQKMLEILLRRKTLFETSDLKTVTKDILYQLGQVSDFELSSQAVIAEVDRQIALEIDKIIHSS